MEALVDEPDARAAAVVVGAEPSAAAAALTTVKETVPADDGAFSRKMGIVFVSHELGSLPACRLRIGASLPTAGFRFPLISTVAEISPFAVMMRSDGTMFTEAEEILRSAATSMDTVERIVALLASTMDLVVAVEREGLKTME